MYEGLPSEDAKPPRDRRAIWILVVVIGIGVLIWNFASTNKHNGSSAAGITGITGFTGDTTPATTPPTLPPVHSDAGGPTQGIPGSDGMTLNRLTTSVSGQIRGHTPQGFGVHHVKSVTCNPPKRWADGNTFTCWAYGRYGRVLGTYTGTVTPDQGSYLEWNGGFVPSGL